jgi:hypothetical protein
MIFITLINIDNNNNIVNDNISLDGDMDNVNITSYQ